jgi:phosphoribosylformylglycinamidine cyclo-ligase
MATHEELTYRSAGVNIDAGNKAVDLIKEQVKRTWQKGVLGGFGSFGGMFALAEKYQQPVLVAGTDGVGTKLRVAMLTGKHETIGIDAVAMCVNDILVHGATPLFFLDYLAVGKLVPEKVAEIVKGVAAGCLEAGCALIGGETAEMPGFYGGDDYDVAGFAVGVVERNKIIDGSRIQPGDKIIGLAASGLHSNGFSLARKILLEVAGLTVDTYVPELGKTLGAELLTPTRIYVRTVLSLLSSFTIKGMAHITGGGLVENVVRTFPRGLTASLRRDSWPVPPIFELIRQRGSVDLKEMYRVFNMGIGFVTVVRANDAAQVLAALADKNEAAFLIGEVVPGENGARFEPPLV